MLAPYKKSFGVYWTYFFRTSTLTFCMSTFVLNSGGNFVDFNNFASTELAILICFALLGRPSEFGGSGGSGVS